MKRGRVVFWLIALAAIAGVAITRPWNRRQETLDRYARETLQEFAARLAQTPAAGASAPGYVDDLMASAHPDAWSAHHRIEADQQVLIDVPEYEQAMLHAMIARARAENASQLADALARVLQEWYEVE